MKVEDLKLKGAKLISPQIFRDERGFFLESYRVDQYRENKIPPPFVQDNHSYSKKGVIRGMHFQADPGQGKLVRVVLGEIFDVIVDIRKSSPTFGKWEGVYLNGEEQKQLYIPVGFAHGFCTLSPEAHVLYKVTTSYSENAEKGFRFDDPKVGIKWPISDPILSARDRENPYFHELRW